MSYVGRPVQLAFMDIETSSLDKSSCEVREVCLIPLDIETLEERKDVPCFVHVVRALKPQDPGAFAIHNIAPELGDGWTSVAAQLWSHVRHEWFVPDGTLLELGGHNIGEFDYPVMERCLDGALSKGAWGKLFHYRLRDTSPVVRFLCDAGLLPPKCFGGKLMDVCTALDMPEAGKAHRAMPDAIDEAELYRRMIRHVRGMMITPDEALRRATDV